MIQGVSDRIDGNVDARCRSRVLSQFRRAVPRAAADIESACSIGQTRGESISGDVLGPKIVIDFAGNDPFARELVHRTLAGVTACPTLIREFTSTRQGKWNWP